MKAAVVLLCALLPAAAGAEPASFLSDAAARGQAEILLAELALAKARDPAVMQFAARLIEDHRRGATDLMLIARHKSITLPGGPPPETLDALSRLAELSGETFERDYVRQALEDHHRLVAAYQAEAATGTDLQTVMLAEQSLVFLDVHQAMAERLAECVQGGVKRC